MADSEIGAFLERVERALSAPDVVDRAIEVEEWSLSFRPAELVRQAWRSALPPGRHVRLRVLARYQVPARLERLAREVRDPSRRLARLREVMMDAATLLSEARGGGAEAARRALGRAAEAVRLADDLARAEEREGPERGGEADLVVECPLDGQGASWRWSCSSCCWRGPEEVTCLAPEARRLARELVALGHGPLALRD